MIDGDVEIWNAIRRMLTVTQSCMYQLVLSPSLHQLPLSIIRTVITCDLRENMRRLLEREDEFTWDHSNQLNFAIFPQILQFYQSYRTVERSLMIYYPSSAKDGPLGKFGHEIQLHML